MQRPASYSDEQLARAIAASDSWRGCLRKLGFRSASSGSMRAVRARADRLGIDYQHFRGPSRWTDVGLRTAVLNADSWQAVVDQLGLHGVHDIASVQGHAARLGIDVGHLAATQPSVNGRTPRPDVAHLHRAGSLLAAAWYTLCGYEVSWPLEPARYDLLVVAGTAVRRVQVKTTTTRAGGSWKAYLSKSGGARRTYSPNEIDEFFVVDGDLGQYVIPIAAVGGLHAIHLRAYRRFRVPGRPPASPATGAHCPGEDRSRD